MSLLPLVQLLLALSHPFAPALSLEAATLRWVFKTRRGMSEMALYSGSTLHLIPRRHGS